MNRRNFLKALGAALAVAGTLRLATAELVVKPGLKEYEGWQYYQIPRDPGKAYRYVTLKSVNGMPDGHYRIINPEFWTDADGAVRIL